MDVNRELTLIGGLHSRYLMIFVWWVGRGHCVCGGCCGLKLRDFRGGSGCAGEGMDAGGTWIR